MKKSSKSEPSRDRPRRSNKVPHTKRPEVRGACHVVLRVVRGLPWLRTPKTYRVLEGALRKANQKAGFSLAQYSVQGDHLHLLIEAQDKRALARGMQGLLISVAKRLNRLWRRKKGSVFADRYFSRLVEGFRPLRTVLKYIHNNGRKHGVWGSSTQPDPYSSGRWFRSWGGEGNIRRPLRASPVVEPGEWTLQLATQRGLQLDDVPGKPWWPLEDLQLV